jgi:hypothetical protein
MPVTNSVSFSKRRFELTRRNAKFWRTFSNGGPLNLETTAGGPAQTRPRRGGKRRDGDAGRCPGCERRIGLNLAIGEPPVT